MDYQVTRNDLPQLRQKLRRIREFPQRHGETWVRESTERAERLCRHQLETQGRGGTGPPLSPLTREIYRRTGEPDGSGIRNHIRTEYHRDRDRFEGILGILDGKPTMVAKVQNDGCVIPVTEKMRGWFASIGLPLRTETTSIYIPPRYFWDYSQRDAKREARQDLLVRWRAIG